MNIIKAKAYGGENVQCRARIPELRELIKTPLGKTSILIRIVNASRENFNQNRTVIIRGLRRARINRASHPSLIAIFFSYRFFAVLQREDLFHEGLSDIRAFLTYCSKFKRGINHDEMHLLAVKA